MMALEIRMKMESAIPNVIPAEFRAINLSQGMLSSGNLRTDRLLGFRIIIDLERLCHNILDHLVSMLSQRPIHKRDAARKKQR